MRFIHTADIHLGAWPDRNLPWGEARKTAIWNTFRSIIDITAREQAELLLIAGDFFHCQPLPRELKEVNYLFSRISSTRVVIIAGNHDYLRSTSPYLTADWAPNVTFLDSEEMSSVYIPALNTEVHGFSYHRPEIREALYDDLRAPEDGRIHILLAHGGDSMHIPVSVERLASAGFDYVALGHIHQPALYEKAGIAWSGSPEPMDRTDLGKRGIILGECGRGNVSLRFLPIATGEYRRVTINVSPSATTGQIADVLRRKLNPDPRFIYRITLSGFRDPEILFDEEVIRSAGQITDVTDLTEPEYDLNRLAQEHEHDLISHVIRELSGPEATSRQKKALRYSLQALLGSSTRSGS